MPPTAAGPPSGSEPRSSRPESTGWTVGLTTRIVVVGLGAGLLAGLLGVGGGTVLVPALVALAGMDQRRAAATSLVAIVPTAAVGAVAYGAQGQVSVPAALLLAVGSLTGVRLGVALLHRLPAAMLPWLFSGFVVLVVVSQQLVVPVREAQLALDVPRGIVLVGIGLVAGAMAGLVGVGGGVVVVPGLEVVLGLGDLLARGTSLLVIVPTAVWGTVGNLARGSADLRTGVVVGLAAAAASPVGALLAERLSPRAGSAVFGCFLVVVLIHQLWRARHQSRNPARSS
ncbi:MAG: sulfite exporter TauE/SafE family protein [Actinomyces sp.]|uniref:sulfite exporter TauE/SafE family protein n=1 Tax=Actinomyces sp. TaxID=29317 RepID=UPI0026DBD7F4|nr:sulfite exporter TauE/SafE family protein [Actinomyces sp.]MDO4244237.1 sulfite exporter TauE/SafE family protein [Actinomyces sp.]